MRDMGWRRSITNAVLVAACAAVTACGNVATYGQSSVVPARSVARTGQVMKGVDGPRKALRTLARSHHATFVAGPLRGRDGLFAAYSVVRGESLVHDPRSRLILLRWRDGRWVTDGRLHAKHYGGYWDFPSNNLATARVEHASAEAPVFDGREGGGGGYGLMIAVRHRGHWLWARFDGCPVRGQCPPISTRSDTVANGRIVKRHVVSMLGNCRPDCASSRIVYRNRWSWRPKRPAFVLTHQRAQPDTG